MFDRLFDLLSGIWHLLLPWVVLDDYQAGVILRLGRWHRTLGPGFHWTWPALERVIVEDVVLSTANLHPQSLTSRDGRSLVIQAVLTSSVRDVKKLLLDVENREGVLVDAALGIIADAVAETCWAEITQPGFAELVTKRVRAKAFRFGIEVHSVQFSDLQLARSLRLWPAS